MRPTALPRLALVALLLVGPLLGMELALRGLVAAQRLPIADAHRDDFEITWTNLERTGTPDVLILGDSIAQQGIEPSVLERIVRKSTGRHITAFNAASPGGGLGVNAAIVEQLAREGRLPPVILVAVASGTLSTDVTFHETFSRTVMGRLFTGCGVPMALVEAVDCHAGRASLLWRWRGRPFDIVEAVLGPIPETDRTDGLRLRADGFRIGRGRSVTQIEAQLSRADLEKRRVQLVPEVESSWRWLVSTAEANGAVVIPVTIPDPPPMRDRLEQLQPGREQLFWDGIDRLDAGGHPPFVRVAALGPWWGDGMARNFNHLSHDGAREFTRQLWSIDDFREQLLQALERGS